VTCLSAVTRSMYADDALPPDQAAAAALHLTGCAACSTKVASLRAERVALRAAFDTDNAASPVPAFARPARSSDLLVLTVGVLAVAAVAAGFWTAVAQAIPSGLQWLNPFQPGELFERAISFIPFILNEGTTMLTSALNLVAALLAVLLVAWTTLSLVRSRGSAAVLASLLIAVLALPGIGHALELRHADGVVTVAAGETIDDTLFAAGQTVAIDGNVNGDLFAFGRTVTIRGNVTGNVISGAETVTIEGTVGGDVIGGGRAVTLRGSHVGRNFFGFGRDLDLGADSEVSSNAFTFGETAHVDGRVGVDLSSFGANVLVSGNVQRDFEAFGNDISLLPSARVGRNVTAHVDNNDKLQIAEGATIGGTVERKIVEREQRRSGNRYLTVGFYVGQFVRLAAGFVTGLLLLWAFPVLRTLSLPTAIDALRAGGIGLVAAVVLPIAAILACVTIVGAPLGILTLILGAIGLYFSKAVVAQLIGRALFRSPAGPPHYAATLLAGLVVVIIAINLPLVGGIVNVVLMVLGFGMIVSVLLGRYGATNATF
jgi:cytoskeletal protein CcmA (bactofilin family)